MSLSKVLSGRRAAKEWVSNMPPVETRITKRKVPKEPKGEKVAPIEEMAPVRLRRKKLTANREERTMHQ